MCRGWNLLELSKLYHAPCFFSSNPHISTYLFLGARLLFVEVWLVSLQEIVYFTKNNQLNKQIRGRTLKVQIIKKFPKHHLSNAKSLWIFLHNLWFLFLPLKRLHQHNSYHQYKVVWKTLSFLYTVFQKSIQLNEYETDPFIL